MLLTTTPNYGHGLRAIRVTCVAHAVSPAEIGGQSAGQQSCRVVKRPGASVAAPSAVNLIVTRRN